MSRIVLLLSLLTAVALATDFGPNALSDIGAKRTCIKSPTPYTEIRCFYTYIPDCAGENSPLLFDIHGSRSSPKASAKYTGWIQKANKNCFVVVLPSGNIDRPATMNKDNACFAMPTGLKNAEGIPAAPCCCFYNRQWTSADVTDDATFLRRVAEVTIDNVPRLTSNNVTIDANRIYMAGHSNGCIASIAMATIHSDLVAAVCCHAGVAQASFPISYQATPMWIAHGTSDTIVSYEGASPMRSRYSTIGALETHELIAKANRCKESKAIEFNSRGNRKVTRYISEDCANNTSVELVALDGIGHFPFQNFDGFGSGGNFSTKIDTTQLAWNFCSKYSLPGSVSNIVEPPNASLCNDSPLRMKHGNRFRKCSWVENNLELCRRKTVRTHCPVTCSASKCLVDSLKRFKLEESGEEKFCNWVEQNPSKRCQKLGVKDTCRFTCKDF